MLEMTTVMFIGGNITGIKKRLLYTNKLQKGPETLDIGNIILFFNTFWVKCGAYAQNVDLLYQFQELKLNIWAF